MVELVLFFTGLTAYQPERDQEGEITAITAYMVDATRPRDVPGHMNHTAGLLINEDYVQDKDRHEPDPLGDGWWWFPIGGKRVSVNGLATTDLNVLECRNDPKWCPDGLTTCPLNAPQAQYFDWVMPLQRIHGDKRLESFIEQPERFRVDLIHAIFDLPQSNVTTLLSKVDLCGEKKDRIAIWEVEKGSFGEEIRQAMAEIVISRSEVPLPHLSLCFCSSFDPSRCTTCEDSLELKPHGGKIEVGVLNIPRRHRRADRVDSECGDLDWHFPNLYRLFRDPTLLHVPRIVDVCPEIPRDERSVGAYAELDRLWALLEAKRLAANNPQCPGASLEGL